MGVIDAHINVTPDGRWYRTDLDASVERALREMDKAGVEKAVIVATADAGNREFALETAARRADRFAGSFALRRLDQQELDEAKRLIGQGLVRLIKLHPRSTGILPLDPALDPFLALAEERDLPVMICGYMRGPAIPMQAVEPLVFDELARRRPNLTLVLSHAGSYRPLDALAVAQSHAKVYLDLSHVLEYFRGSSLEQDFRFIMRRLDRKIIYGSDFPEYPIDGYLDRARQLAAEVEGFDATGFFGDHARRIFRLDS